MDWNQANVAESIDTNVSGMMPNGDPAPKRKLKTWQKIVLGVTWGAVVIKDYYDNYAVDSNEVDPQGIQPDKDVDTGKDNDFISIPIKDKLDEVFEKNW